MWFTTIDWKNGEFVEEIKGQYLMVTLGDEMNIQALHHIVKKYICHRNHKTTEKNGKWESIVLLNPMHDYLLDNAHWSIHKDTM